MQSPGDLGTAAPTSSADRQDLGSREGEQVQDHFHECRAQHGTGLGKGMSCGYEVLSRAEYMVASTVGRARAERFPCQVGDPRPGLFTANGDGWLSARKAQRPRLSSACYKASLPF